MPVVASLFETEFDFPSLDERPKAEVMVASIPRSGSTIFCLDLWETGVLGAPLEYLNFHLIRNIPRWREEILNPMEYWRRIRSVRTAENGVFSYKMFPGCYKQVAEVSRELLALIAPTDVIYLTREDLDAQAISYSKAMQSGAWFGDVVSDKPLNYSYDHIVECKNLIRRQMEDWEYIFDLTKTNVVRVTYEQWLRDKEAVIVNVAAIVTGSETMKRLAIPRTSILYRSRVFWTRGCS